ncbi:MAG: peptidylprolyl isomerase [Sideroxydans sp.]|nr:peptidylprolyl isomerase [Sideroxydans sp.]
MFDFVHEKKRLVQIVLLLIILPFAFWGVDSYRKTSGSGDALATVNGERITQQDFDNALKQQQDRMRSLMGANYDPAMFNQPAVRYSILDNLVSQRLLQSNAQSAGLAVSDEQLAQVIAGIEAFQKDGKFDKQQYEAVLGRQNLSPLTFESRVREQLAMNQLAEAYNQNGYASNTVADNLIRLNEQQRVVSVAQISPDAFLKQASVSDAEIKNYYEKNQQEFRTPEQARVEYVTFSADALLPQVKVGDDEVRQYYQDHQAEFGTQEQRDAAHILISVAAQASAAEKQAAKAKAERILQQVRQYPAKFAELAKKFSEDPGSASSGGDLGFFGRGMMVKPFEDAVFSLKPGEISGLVQSDFGFHIIKLLAARPARFKPLAEVRSSIEQLLKQNKAGDKFAELADKFSDTVYEQSDSLKPAAELVKMPVQQSGWLSKGNAGSLPWTEKALQAVFSDDVLKEKRNSTAVEVAPNMLLAVRLLEHKTASTRPLAEVAAEIRQKLLNQQALELATKQGQAVLAQLQHGDKVTLNWKAAQTVTRAQRAGLEAALVNLVFRADMDKLPAYVGMESIRGGYVLARVEAVRQVGAIDDAKRARYVQQLRQLSGQELFTAYLADAREHAKINMAGFAAAEEKK